MSPHTPTKLPLILAFALLTATTTAQRPSPPAEPFTPSPIGAFDPLKTFAPLTLPNPVNDYRSASGTPGPHYWQNRADYNLHATIDTTTKTLTGTETITYTNNSPDTLTSLWLNLEQNTYRPDSRAHAFMPDAYRRYFGDHHTDGYILDSVELQRLTAATKTPAHTVVPKTVITDTRLQIQLPDSAPLPHAAKIRILIHYHYTIPGTFGGRTSWAATRQGETYDIAQWYPRLCVYDDLHGWDTQPYLANEFYLEYGHFDYSVTVPSNFLVAGSGELVNPTEVLSTTEQSRLKQARTSDKTLFIRTTDEATTAAASHPATTKTWHFTMDPTRDVSFSASSSFIWDAARINVPAGAGKAAHAALAQSFYPIEAAGDDAWGKSTEYVKDTVERMSARWYPYPWPNAVSVAGPTSGMEYPGIVFDGPDEKGKVLFFVTAHEIGHTWFPMIVGSNERRDAWIDEGFNTFIDTFESDDYNHGQYGPKRDGEYAPDASPTAGSPADQIVKLLTDPNAPIILTRADAIREKYRHPITYYKSALGLTLLRNDILGPERFDHAFRKFIADWAFKHPSPSDFFRAMESEGGEDLSYFWRGWYFNNWQLDLAITSAKLSDTDPTHSVSITVTNNGPLVLPATLRVQLADGSHTDVAIPVETFLQQSAHTFIIATPTRATSATIDPDHRIPDSDRTNNEATIK